MRLGDKYKTKRAKYYIAGYKDGYFDGYHKAIHKLIAQDEAIDEADEYTKNISDFKLKEKEDGKDD